MPRLLRAGLLGACAFAGGACATALGGGPRSAQGDAPYEAMQQLGRVLVEVENDYVDPVDRGKLLKGAIKGMVEGLDPHSSYMPADEYQTFESETEGQFGGIGIEVENRNDQLIVLAPIEGSPADRAGIRSGDLIVSVDGRDPSSEPLDKLVKRLRGTPGSHVKIGVRRGGVADLLTFDLAREIIHVPSVASRLLVDRVGYVRIKQFQERTHDELLEASARLRAKAGGRLTGLILDLRADPGGLVDQAADVADEFLDDGIIYTARHRGRIVDEVHAHAGGAFTQEPCVVLVNQWTASASELVAGALQDHKRCTVVGERTFGKGSVQAIVPLPGGAGMRLTVSRYYTPGGHAIQADGVHPDVAVETGNKDAAGVSYREGDLEGHLAAQPSGASPEAPKRVVVVDTDAAVPAPDPGGSDAKNVPEDPDKGGDGILKVGWQVLRKAMSGAAAVAHAAAAKAGLGAALERRDPRARASATISPAAYSPSSTWPASPARMPARSIGPSLAKGHASRSGGTPKSEPGASSGRPLAPITAGASRPRRNGGRERAGSSPASSASAGAYAIPPPTRPPAASTTAAASIGCASWHTTRQWSSCGITDEARARTTSTRAAASARSRARSKRRPAGPPGRPMASPHGMPTRVARASARARSIPSDGGRSSAAKDVPAAATASRRRSASHPRRSSSSWRAAKSGEGRTRSSTCRSTVAASRAKPGPHARASAEASQPGRGHATTPTRRPA